MGVLAGFGLRFRPLPSTFWGRSKNKSCSITCDLPNLEVLAGGLEFFRPPKISLGTHALPVSGVARGNNVSLPFYSKIILVLPRV
ncbi:unnamed protein product [Prunus armeniaca]